MIQRIMLIGIVLAAIGLIFCAFTTRWQNGWIFNYRITNWRLFLFGILLLIIGLGIALVPAYANGQLG
jgi:hypothetical protein